MNKFFHYKDRGGSLRGEILAGLGMLFLSVCGIFINIQLIAKLRITGDYAAASSSEVALNGEIYAQAWFLSMLIAFFGSLLLGVIARLPLVQIGGLGLSTVLVSMVGAATGISYYNLLFVCFVSSIVYTVLVSIPGLKKWIFNALPQPVRRALPAATGLLMAWIALQLTGIVNVNSSQISIYGAGDVLDEVNDSVSLMGFVPFSTFSYATDKFHPLLLICAVAVIATFVLYLIFRQRTKRPFLFSLLGGTVVFFVLYLLLVCFSTATGQFSLDSLWGRAWMVGSEDTMLAHLSATLSSISFGRIFTSGMDFSAYIEAGGNVAVLFATAILDFLFINMYEAEAVLQVESEDIQELDANDQKGVQKTLICNGVMNIIAPMFGGVPVTVSPTSCAGSKDGAKSGLASVIVCIGLGISAFFWLIPAVFATTTSYDITFNMYGHYGTVMQLLSESAFVVADAVMVIVGLSMAARSMSINWKNMKETACLAVTVVGTLMFSNLAGGVAAGTVAYIIVSLTMADPEKKKIRKSKKAEAEKENAAENIEEESSVTDQEIETETSEAAVSVKEPGFKGVTILNAIWAVVSLVLLVLILM